MIDYISNLLQQAQQFLANKQYQQCQQLCLAVLQQDKNNTDAMFLLVLIEFDLGEVEAGKAQLKNVIKASPQQIQYRIKLIEVLLVTGYLAHAYSECIAAKKCQLYNQHTLNMLGTFFNRLDCHFDALEVYQKAENLNEKSSSVLLFNLATTYKFLGEISKAKDYMLMAINAGFHTSSYLPLAELTEKKDLPELEQLLLKKHTEYQRIGSRHINREAQANLLFALALCYEKNSQYELSFSYLVQANELKHKQHNYHQDNDNSLFHAIKKRFNSELEIAQVASKNPKTTPIFIVGMPRTGSTLLERILSSHTDVTSVGEIQTMPIEFRRLCNTTSSAHLDEQVILASSKVDFKILAERYIEELQRFEAKEAYVIDKLPYNYLYVGAIKAAFPHAKIIHITRNPLDTCFSNFKQSYAHVYPFSYDLLDLGNYYLNYRSLMMHWDKQFPEQICHVTYESLVENSVAETKRVLAYCELPWQDACVDPQHNQMPVSTASAVQVRQPIYKTSRYRWKNYQQELKPLIEFFAENNISCDV